MGARYTLEGDEVFSNVNRQIAQKLKGIRITNQGGRLGKETTICVLLDAFRWDYITEEDTPFLFKLTQAGIFARRLISTAGFTQRSAVFTGTYDDTRNQLTAFIHNEKHSPFRFLKNNKRYWKFDKTPWWAMLPSFLPFMHFKNLCQHHRSRYEAAARKWVNQEAKKYATHAPSAHIPFRILPFFYSVEDATPIWKPAEDGVESIFGVFQESSIPLEYIMYPLVNCEDDRALELMCERAPTEAAVYFVTFTEADSVCHRCGTNTVDRRRAVGEIDRKMRILGKTFESVFDNVRWVVFSDHGMADIQELVDGGAAILEAAKKYKFRNGVDFLMFLDSTMIRLWQLNERAKGFVQSILQELPALRDKGEVIDSTIAKRYRIPIHHSPCGDAIWWALPGVIVSPDYFFDREYPPKGMHGYFPDEEDAKGFAVVSGKGIPHVTIEQVDLVDICPTLCDAVGVRYPRDNEGKSMMAVISSRPDSNKKKGPND